MFVCNHICLTFTARTDTCIYIGEKIPPLLSVGVLHDANPGGSSSRMQIPPASPPRDLFPSCHSDDNDLCCGHLLESFNVTIIF